MALREVKRGGGDMMLKVQANTATLRVKNDIKQKDKDDLLMINYSIKVLHGDFMKSIAGTILRKKRSITTTESVQTNAKTLPQTY